MFDVESAVVQMDYWLGFLYRFSLPAVSVVKAALSVWLFRKIRCPGSIELAIGYCLALVLDVLDFSMGVFVFSSFEANEVLPGWFTYWGFGHLLLNLTVTIVLLAGFWKLVHYVVRSIPVATRVQSSAAE
jgi:hypothetical protein